MLHVERVLGRRSIFLFHFMKILPEHIYPIKKAFAEMQSMDDLLVILNIAKRILFGEKAIAFSIRQLNYYTLSKYKDSQYKQSFIPKKSGGKRTITAPVKNLKHLQACLNFVLQVLFEPHDAATGFVPGKSIVDNAKEHVGKWFVFNLDLKDFFPSIDQKRVWACLQLPPFDLNTNPERKQLANRLAILCCAPIEFIAEDGSKEKRNALPQGAPTSPTITNIIAQKMDKRLQGVANRFHITYTRYADDITYSANKDIFQKDGEVVQEIRRIITGQNFVVNENKVRLQQQGFKQEVTGLIVNKKVNVPRKYTRQLRQWLYLWETYGHDKAYSFFLKDYLSDKGHLKKGLPSMICVIGGKLDYLKMVKGKSDSVFLKLNERYKKLFNTNTDLLIDRIFDIWEKEGIDAAMKLYYNDEKIIGQ